MDTQTEVAVAGYPEEDMEEEEEPRREDAVLAKDEAEVKTSATLTGVAQSKK